MAIRIDVEIDAPEERVWATLVEVERRPEWTRSMRRVELLDGSALEAGSRVRIKQPWLPATVWRVSEYAAGERFAWEAPTLGATTRAGHAVVPRGAGVTVTLTAETRGRVSWLAGPFVDWVSRRYMAQEAAGLKRRCEGGG